MRELTIQPVTEGKGRSFRSTLLAYVEANHLWDGGSSGNTRPIWMMFAGSENELRPFVANLRTGRKADFSDKYQRRGGERLEILKSARFQCAWQRTPHGSTATLFEPELFRLDPGMVDPQGVKFCILPDKGWVEKLPKDPAVAQYIATHFEKVPGDQIVDMIRLAPLFAAYLDRRTRCPLIPDLRFYAQILCGCLEEGLASLSKTVDYSYREVWGTHRHIHFEEYKTSEVGLLPGVVMHTSHLTLEEFLAKQVQLFFKNTMVLA